MPGPRISDVFCLSECGSTRATAYDFANKSVRIGETTHAVWLDGVSTVMAAAFDHGTGRWNVPTRIDDGRDNHTCPSLTAGTDSHLRVAYGPRSCGDPFSERPVSAWEIGKFRLMRSVRPNDGSAWERYSHVGYAATYGCLVSDAGGRDHLVYQGGAAPPSVRYERRQSNDAWDRDAKLSYQDVGHNYTHSGANLVVAPDGRMLCGFHYYALPRDTSLGVCALTSADGGDTWTHCDGSAARLPLVFDPAFALPCGGSQPYLGSLAVDHAGRWLAVTFDMGDTRAGCWVSVWESGGWRSTRVDGVLALAAALPLHVQSANVTVDAAGRVLVVVGAVDAAVVTVRERWAHPSSHVYLLASDDNARTFTCTRVSDGQTRVADWLPTISRVGPNHDLRRPLILWTQGVSGTGGDCRDPERTRVLGAFVEA